MDKEISKSPLLFIESYCAQYSRITAETLTLVQKHVEIILDQWILQTTRTGKHVTFSQQFFTFCASIFWEVKVFKNM